MKKNLPPCVRDCGGKAIPEKDFSSAQYPGVCARDAVLALEVPESLMWTLEFAETN